MNIHRRALSAALILLSLAFTLPADARSREDAPALRYTVAAEDLRQINPIKMSPLRASRDALSQVEATHHAAISEEVRARGQLEAAEEHLARVRANGSSRLEDLRAARTWAAWAEAEHEAALAELERLDALRIYHLAELELGRLQLLADQGVSTEAYQAWRFEAQFDRAAEALDAAELHRARVDARLNDARAEWAALAVR